MVYVNWFIQKTMELKTSYATFPFKVVDWWQSELLNITVSKFPKSEFPMCPQGKKIVGIPCVRIKLSLANIA